MDAVKVQSEFVVNCPACGEAKMTLRRRRVGRRERQRGVTVTLRGTCPVCEVEATVNGLAAPAHGEGGE